MFGLLWKIFFFVKSFHLYSFNMISFYLLIKLVIVFFNIGITLSNVYLMECFLKMFLFFSIECCFSERKIKNLYGSSLVKSFLAWILRKISCIFQKKKTLSWLQGARIVYSAFSLICIKKMVHVSCFQFTFFLLEIVYSLL